MIVTLKTQIFHKVMYDLKGHKSSHKVILKYILYLNSDIIKTINEY